MMMMMMMMMMRFSILDHTLRVRIAEEIEQ